MEFEYGYGYVLGCMETMGVWKSHFGLESLDI